MSDMCSGSFLVPLIIIIHMNFMNFMRFYFFSKFFYLKQI